MILLKVSHYSWNNFFWHVILLHHWLHLLQFDLAVFWVCVKRIRFFNCLCPSSPSSCLSASGIWNIGEYGANKYFTEHQIANNFNTIQLFVPIKKKIFVSIFFGTSCSEVEFPSHLLICVSLKQRKLSSGEKPVYNVQLLISEQIAFAPVLYFGQVFAFCRWINRSMLEWFLLITGNILWPNLQIFLVETFLEGENIGRCQLLNITKQPFTDDFQNRFSSKFCNIH